MVKFEAALMEHNGTPFAIVAVLPRILNSPEREDVRNNFRKYFPLGIPIIFTAKDADGNPKYQGKYDIVKFLYQLDPKKIPWERYDTI
ncbi:hypothetical protein [Desulforamulus ruminis]|uniref:Uncharacterized protein n=2 Tax=Desulforamulus ruminis TaxID=1564 RepID=F6DS95_DESRL|nr:hypothetical protein [Desulforamulus ruminis]AEG59874.1 hypothetical protein Desru_1609 [Desulforamulus ruminis DSM 2154]